ncbi:MAG: hypothetical protein WDA09_05420 [Bacteriovoracaceae bacterium]
MFSVFIVKAKGANGLYKFVVNSREGNESLGWNFTDILEPQFIFERVFDTARAVSEFYNECLFHFREDMVREDWVFSDEETISDFAKIKKFHKVWREVSANKVFADFV